MKTTITFDTDDCRVGRARTHRGAVACAADDSMNAAHVVSMCGGKDSTATAILVLELRGAAAYGLCE
ncbi:hypothetical protein Q3P06_23535 [Ralstonia pseudosolanacearum]|uniref:hypothetical protein n=1 Tax=Ralstonia pseudosolanacearum TaxID=1310165 RepID=UPI0026774769|nr:hypothetical protein [Ralstonia pseudosolanacearum]MDO3514867.1 hypothetical protein [Ralstonia pseudosolanacearum]MDO3633496.1 hypothetical protein [Ralstonia pseudosolanacearum]